MDFHLADLYESVADAVGERTALVCEGTARTYAELDARANRLGHHLQAAGIRPGDHVGLYAYNGFPYVEAMLACFKIRAVPINVNYRYVTDELRYLFDDADLVGVLHQREFAPHLNAIRNDLPKLKVFVHVDDDSGETPLSDSMEYEAALSAQSAARDFAPRSPDDLFIIYTGGTTGMPKGVMWRQEDAFLIPMGGGNPLGEPIEKPEVLAENAKARDPQIVQFPVPPLIHGAAQLGVFIGFFWGDKVCLIPKFDAEAVWDVCAKERCNSLTIVGDAMARPMADALEANPGRWDLSSVVYIGSTGALLSQSVKERLRALMPTTFVTENFGSTESGMQGTEAMADARPEGGGMRYALKWNTTVLDDDLKPIEPGSGVIGKVAIRGRVPLGYYKDDEKTKATFTVIDGERFVIPGDLATIDADGTVIVFGRGSQCINTGGEKVYPEEVESAIKAHADVYDAVVVGVPDERWGERVAALVQLNEGASMTLEQLDTHCRAHVAGYKVPRELILVDEIARQPSGKPDYPWAKQLAAERTQA